MSEPGRASRQQSSGLSPVAKIAIGCGIALVVCVVAVGIAGAWLWHQLADGLSGTVASLEDQVESANELGRELRRLELAYPARLAEHVSTIQLGQDDVDRYLRVFRSL